MKKNVNPEQYDNDELLNQDRQIRRLTQKGYKRRRQPDNGRTTAVANTLADMDDSEQSWVPSYAAALDPKHHERYWLIDSLGWFYRNNLITDVTRLVKGGKEANVYTCLGHPALNKPLLAAKLYRPRMLRSLKNDAVYKAGRQLRDAEGKQLKGRREKLAIRKKSDFGKEVDIQWWIGNEYMTQTTLYEAGADVPQPIAHQGNCILMSFIGDGNGPAPTLSEIHLPYDEAEALFHRTLKNIDLMLQHNFVHGDLSAYNILYWEGNITLIDFPQVVDVRSNPYAFELLSRDITRVCNYYGRYQIQADPKQLATDFWQTYQLEL